jgi:hypothetical protein
MLSCNDFRAPRIVATTFAALLMAGLGCASAARARSDSPAPDTASSESANEAADRGMYKSATYRNVNIKGPAVVVVEGEIKSNNATFLQKYSSNNIADYAELELGKANFKILERSDLGPLKREFQIAYSAGDPDEARKILSKGKFKATRWVLRFDVLKAEPVAESERGFRVPLGGVRLPGIGSIGGFGGGGTYEQQQGASVWIIGMRYTVIDAQTTEQEATGYFEQKMEAGTKSQGVGGVYQQRDSGQLGLDSLVQRLVQDCVVEIDARYK